MSDEPVPGPLHPALDQLRQSFAEPEGQQWASDQAHKVQAYLTTRNIVDANKAAGDQFIQNTHATQQNLVKMVQGDPTSTGLAMDLAGSSAQAIAAHHPDDGERAGAADALTKQFRGEIARASVQTWAGQSQQAGRNALGALRDHLSPQDHAALGAYIDNLETLRQADNSAQMAEHVRQIGAQSDDAAMGHLGSLTDPDTGAVQFPPAWGTRMMQDNRVAGGTKGALYNAFSAVQKNGDPVASDPDVLTNLLHRSTLPPQHPGHPSVDDVLNQAGNGLTLADAQFVGNRVGPQSPQTRDQTAALVNMLHDARASIGNDQAYGRFANWAVPAVRNGASLDPAAPNYLLRENRIQDFAPSGSELVAPAQQSSAGKKPSLADIFGGKR